MKKTFIKLLCLTCSVIILLTSCNITNTKDKNDFDIEQEEYLIRFSISGPLRGQYIFLLLPDNTILAQYTDENSFTQKHQTKLNDVQIVHMQEYLNEVLSLAKEDIEGYVYFTDWWYVSINFNDVDANFDYGASKNNAVNILLEQTIGCFDSKKSLETLENLNPAPSHLRQLSANHATLKEVRQ